MGISNEPLTFEKYAQVAQSTAIYPQQGTIQGMLYSVLGLTGEAGEVANKVKKILRDDNGELTETRKEQIKLEIGGTLWYIAACCKELGTSMEDVARANLTELLSRKERNVIKGDGDTR